MSLRHLIHACAVLVVLAVLGGCGRHVVGMPVANLRPAVSLSGAPAPATETTYAVRLRNQDSVRGLVEGLNRLEGVQSVEVNKV